MSRLIDIDQNGIQEPELPGHKKCYVFEHSPEINTQTKDMNEHIFLTRNEAISVLDEDLHLSIIDKEL